MLDDNISGILLEIDRNEFKSPFWAKDVSFTEMRTFDCKSRWRRWERFGNKQTYHYGSLAQNKRKRTTTACMGQVEPNAFLLHKWKYSDSPNCGFGSVQTIFATHRYEGNLSDIDQTTNEAIQWITDLRVEI